jgi:replication factor C subunit 2/4
MSGFGSQEICDIGYSPHDIITTFFRVVKLSPELPEFLKLEFIRVS